MLPDFHTLILQIDDDPDDHLLLEETITKIDPQIQVLHAYSGDDAILTLNQLEKQNHLPDLILLDMNMPMKCGDEVAKEISGTSTWKKIPIILISTAADAAVSSLLENNCIAVVAKPSSLLDLEQVLRSVLAETIT